MYYNMKLPDKNEKDKSQSLIPSYLTMYFIGKNASHMLLHFSNSICSWTNSYSFFNIQPNRDHVWDDFPRHAPDSASRTTFIHYLIVTCPSVNYK